MKKDNKDSKETTIVGWILAPFIGALSLMWSNHVIVQWELSYWQLLLVAIPMLIIVNAWKWMKPLTGILFAVTLLGQFLAWAKIIALPLIK